MFSKPFCKLLSAICAMAMLLLCTFSALALTGDVSADTEVNMKDVLHLRRLLTEGAALASHPAADVNGDGVLNMKDVLQLRLMVAGLTSPSNRPVEDFFTTTTTKKPTTTTTKKPTTTTTTKKPTTTTAVLNTEKVRTEILTLVNKERAKAGLSPLMLDSALVAAAQCRASEVAYHFSHTRPDGQDCFTVLDEYRVEWQMCAENIARGYTSPGAVMDGWMNSEGHRINILTPEFTHIGIGYDDKTKSWTQLFIENRN